MLGPHIGSGWWAKTNRSGTLRRFASQAPYAAARTASALPSMPTTTGPCNTPVIGSS